MKVLLRLRWLETEIPVPGTAEVSAKRWLPPVLVRETPGIGDFLGLKEPIPMAEHEVNKMLVEQTGAEEEKPRIKIDFQKGDTVRVKEGAFENFDGIVEEINSQKGLVGITITIFGRATRVELEYWQVEKV